MSEQSGMGFFVGVTTSYHHPMTSPPRPATPQDQSWVFAANDPALGLPLQHLPYCVFEHPETGEHHLGTVIGGCVLDLNACANSGLFTHLPEVASACLAPLLNPLMALNSEALTSLRTELQHLLRIGNHVPPATRSHVEAALLPKRGLTFLKPVHIPNYTDFYASIHHATRVGRLFRPDNPLLPNYKHVPIGYHGRASSIVISGTPITRPWGQSRPASPELPPTFAPTASLDYELELALYIGQPNALGTPIPIDHAEQHLFGVSLLNDWSARDIQQWESQPLGPFLAKNFATSIGSWVTPLAALEPFRTIAPARPNGDPQPLPYLTGASPLGLRISLEVLLAFTSSGQPQLLSRSNVSDLYWTPAQLIAHHASNGCNVQTGDLLATGTISGPTEDCAGCLLELTRNGAMPITLMNGEARTFLNDGDEVILRGYAEAPGHPRIVLGECRGIVNPARNIP